jgi:type II secretory pathway component PulK
MIISNQTRSFRSDDRRGVVLLIVLIVVAMLALGAYSFVQLMNTEARAAQMYGRQVQAREAADSGVQFVSAVLLDQKYNGLLGSDAYDASSMFHGQLVTDESANLPRTRCRFSVLAPYDNNGGSSVRYGVTDESGKINLNTILQVVQAQGSQSGGGTGGGGGSGTGGGTGDAATNPLLHLPKMTQEIADAILDWLDEDDDPRQYGAESDFYQSLSPPYRPRNGPLHSLDELLHVAGVTPRLLYGEDANQNGVLDANEDDGDLSAPNDDSNGTLDRGWLPYLTLYSHETNKDMYGSPRIFLNNQDLQALFDELSVDEDFGEEKAQFIIAYRLFGAATTGQQGDSQQQGQQQQGQQQGQGQGQSPTGSTGQGGQQQGGQQQGGQQQGGQQQGGQQQPSGSSGGGTSGGQSGPGRSTPQGLSQLMPQGQSQGSTQGGQNQQPSGQGDSSGQPQAPTQVIAGFDASGGAKQTIQSVVDLVGITVNVKVPGQQQTTQLKSPFQETDYDDFLDPFLDRTTTSEKKDLWGRINVNTAPWPALMSLPGMTEDLADAIVAARGASDTSSEAFSNLGVAWLLTSGSVTKDQFKRLEPYITGQSQVFRVQAVGYFEEGGPQARVEAVIDVSGSSPRIRYWRDLTGLGRGVDTQVLMRTVSR